jgi:hypothetical protein
MSKVACIEASVVAAIDVSSAYPEHLNTQPPPGRGTPSISGEAVMLHANTSMQRTYKRGERGQP